MIIEIIALKPVSQSTTQALEALGLEPQHQMEDGIIFSTIYNDADTKGAVKVIKKMLELKAPLVEPSVWVNGVVLTGENEVMEYNRDILSVVKALHDIEKGMVSND